MDKKTVKILKINNQKDLYKGQIDYVRILKFTVLKTSWTRYSD